MANNPVLVLEDGDAALIGKLYANYWGHQETGSAKAKNAVAMLLRLKEHIPSRDWALICLAVPPLQDKPVTEYLDFLDTE